VIERFLAGRYAARAARAPLDRADVQDAGYVVDAFEALGLLPADRADSWRARLARLAEDWTERPLLPDELRRAAREREAPTPTRGDRWRGLEARRVLEAVGALGWRDADALDDPVLVVDRVVVAPAHAPGDLAVSSLVLFDRAVRVHWYAAQDIAGPGAPQLELRDDAGTRYTFEGGGEGAGFELPVVGASSFRPGVPAGASWLEVLWGGARVVRVPLA
jgi:hypothetical protein